MQQLLLLMVLPPAFFFLGERMGATGLAVSWLLPLPLVFPVVFLALRQRIGLGGGHLIEALRIPALNVALMAMGVMALDLLPGVREGHPAFRLLLKSGIGAAIYILLVLRLQRMDIRWILELAGPKIPAWFRRPFLVAGEGPD